MKSEQTSEIETKMYFPSRIGLSLPDDPHVDSARRWQDSVWFKKGSGTAAGKAQRVLGTTVPAPFLTLLACGVDEKVWPLSCRRNSLWSVASWLEDTLDVVWRESLDGP